ncbi:hypothetical protein RB195_005114 [Necator americanus]|uniref:Uncharacterized protein n=1 Tax=Necator americanus TaxID=51031 RepID=A0ABR1BMT9_NECAM
MSRKPEQVFKEFYVSRCGFAVVLRVFGTKLTVIPSFRTCSHSFPPILQLDQNDMKHVRTGSSSPIIHIDLSPHALYLQHAAHVPLASAAGDDGDGNDDTDKAGLQRLTKIFYNV